jgi:hypothetical protein
MADFSTAVSSGNYGSTGRSPAGGVSAAGMTGTLLHAQSTIYWPTAGWLPQGFFQA